MAGAANRPPRRIDVFNGDADGLCALRQLRRAEPGATELVTGVKRDIGLLARVRAEAGDLVTVLDVSLERNRAALLALLKCGVRVRYFDHHRAGEIPSHPGLEAFIDESGGTCTSMLVDRHLGGRFRGWAVTAAFGDGLDQAGLDLGAAMGLGAAELEKLRELGRNLNYNAYGESVDDLLVPPAQLYHALASFEDPLRFVAEHELYGWLDAGRHADLAAVSDVKPYWARKSCEVYLLPDAPSSRRVSGTFANQLARQRTRRAFAVLAPGRDTGFVVSVRVPAGACVGADEFCSAFPGGGGRREAGGIDRLPAADLEPFVRRFAAAFG
jgi:hypothetical protein